MINTLEAAINANDNKVLERGTTAKSLNNDGEDDGLLLVIDDLETKKKIYKDQLKALGETVSEDE